MDKKDIAPAADAQAVALGEQAGWCYPTGGRTRFADKGGTVDATFKDALQSARTA